ncbi:hypothetical protein BGZ76_003630 [Entomortierella beljakovae]|nr:hypothetical protein BGZ76_003630 [Entomortierella beljakovae]
MLDHRAAENSVASCSFFPSFNNPNSLESSPASSSITREDCLQSLADDLRNTREITAKEETELIPSELKPPLPFLPSNELKPRICTNYSDISTDSPSLTQDEEAIQCIPSSKLKSDEGHISLESHNQPVVPMKEVEDVEEIIPSPLVYDGDITRLTSEPYIEMKTNLDSLRDQSCSIWAMRSNYENKKVTAPSVPRRNDPPRRSFQSEDRTPSFKNICVPYIPQQEFKHAMNNIKNAIENMNNSKYGTKENTVVLGRMANLAINNSLAIPSQDIGVSESRSTRMLRFDLANQNVNINERLTSRTSSQRKDSFATDAKTRYSREFLMRFKHIKTPPDCIKYIVKTIQGSTAPQTSSSVSPAISSISPNPKHDDGYEKECLDPRPPPQKNESDNYDYSTRTATGGLR